MKKINLALLALPLVLFSFTGEGKYKTLEIGSDAPMVDLSMKATDGGNYSLDDLKKEMGTAVIFSCNTCPFVIAWEDRYPDLAKLAADNNIGFVLINSNEAKRNGDDSFENMVAHAKKAGYPSTPYLVDEKSQLANAFGAKTTPHVFLFDEEWELVYEGAIDDNYKDAEAATAHYLTEAIKRRAKGERIDPSTSKALGCSIKRVKV